MTIAIGWLAEFDGFDINLWSGDSVLNFDNKVYQPGHFISLDHAGSEIGTPTQRLRASFPVTDPGVRAKLLEDEGPVLVRGRFIFSNDNGLNWTVGGNPFVGRLSNPRLSAGSYSVEIETYGGDVDRGRTVKWSHERQVKRGSGGDLAFEMAGQLESGLSIRWPP